MTPIRAQSRTADTDQQAEATEPVPPAFRRGRHRKPRPRKVLLATGGLAIAAGVLSLVRVTPDSGVGAPGTAEAEPRLNPGAGTTDHAPGASPTAAPRSSATATMGRVSATPTKTAASGTPPSGTTVPTTAPAEAPHRTTTPSAPPRPHPSPTASAPASTPAQSQTPAPAPAPSHSTQPPTRGGGVCVPVIGLCVDLP
ncbi:hypothetical protein J2Z21_002317 [Streptomyces griseochromogenes]|uniref:Serine/threonine protein kinase n=1 Tax=Streptomyces griseochromogenes TaxID=68214 RepID=A0ABS4LPQ1_9ACTN|nr:hypothetical protein [Streptomyces griseochromogenes]MBP2049386.1 hypothetical protein [Streptomyces griseochromogenes]